MRPYRENSLSHTLHRANGQKSARFPAQLYLDVTQDCNLYCEMCRDERSLSGHAMDMALYKRIVDEAAPYVTSWSLFNWGEPLLLGDFRERVSYLASRKRPDAFVDISTNGTLLTDDMIGFLRSHDVAVCVSFDGANKETFEAIRRGSDFAHVCGRLRALAAAYEGADLAIQPSTYTTIQAKNADSLADIARLVHSLGVARFGCGLLVAPERLAAKQDRALADKIEEALETAEEHSMLVDLYPTRVGDFLYDGGRYVPDTRFLVNTACQAALTSASVAYNGDVYLCCNVGERVGNLEGAILSELWLGERYEALREAVNDPTHMPPRCRGCAWTNRNGGAHDVG